MNFLCDQCKQKYHVADEKVQGRAVSHFKCKKCGHVIELRMPSAGSVPPPASAGHDDPAHAHETAPSVLPPAAPHGAASTGTGASLTIPRPGALPSAAPRPATSATATAPSVAPRPATSTGLPTSAARAATAPAPGSAPLPSRAPASAAPAPAAAPRPAPRPATSTGLPTSAARAATATAPSVAPRPATSTGLPTSAARAASGPSPLRSSLAAKGDAPAGPTRSSSSASLLLNATETGWYAGIRDVPVGPLTRNELAAKIDAGEITPDSLVWREGLDDWRPLRNVDELSDLLRSAGQRMSDGLLGTMGRRESSAAKVLPIAQPARPAPRAAVESPEPKDSESFGEDEPTRMTALADLVATAEQGGIASKAASPAPAPKPATSAPAPAPAKPAPMPTPASALPRPTTASAKPAPAPAAKPASATASPAPGTAFAPPAPSTPSVPPGPPTVLAKPAPVFTPPPSEPAVAPAPATSAPAISAPAKAPPVAASAPLVAPAPPASASAPPVVAVAPSIALAGPNEPTQHLESMQPLHAPAKASAAAAVTATPVAERRESRPGGVPIAVWFLMGCVLVAGVAIGMFVRPGAPPTAAAPTPAPAAAPTVATNTTPIGRTVGAEIDLTHAAAALPPPPPAAPAAAAPAAADPNAGHARAGATAGAAARPSGASASAGGSAGHAPQISAEDRARLAMLDNAAGVSTGVGPVGSTALATPTQSDAPAGLTGDARAAQVLNALNRNGSVSSCWTAAQRRNPAHPPESLHVRLDVSPTGRASVTVVGANDPDLTNCIQTRARSSPYGAGGQILTEASYNLLPGQ